MRAPRSPRSTEAVDIATPHEDAPPCRPCPTADRPAGGTEGAADLNWFAAEERRLISFPATFVHPTGHAPLLDDRGTPRPGPAAPTFQTARFAFVCALANLRGDQGARASARDLLASLARAQDDGWADTPTAEPGAAQSLYTLSFIILAGATAMTARIPEGEPLLREAIRVLFHRFWDGSSRLGIDKAGPGGESAPYRGINANMHLVEALCAASDALGEAELEAMAHDVSRFVVSEAEHRSWRINEHYDSRWRALPDFNREHPGHAFRPYGSTIGHGFEWSRLLAQMSTRPERANLLGPAEELYRRAREDGWARDGHDGFVYTVDWDGLPVCRDRLHWVAAEALAASSALARITGQEEYVQDTGRWTAHIRERFVDLENGSWHHRLDPDTLLPIQIEDGKPDLYHAYQAVVLPQIPLATSAAAAAQAAQESTAQ